MMKRLFIIPLIALMAAACTKEDISVSGHENIPMRLYSNAVDSGTSSSAGSAVFLFWDFGDIINNTAYPVPLIVCYPEESIDDYARPNDPYNTGRLYPDGNRRALANGYAPSLLIPATVTVDGEERTDYENLTIPENSLCETDVLTSVQPIVGSASLPFDRNGGEPLEFMHACSKVIIKAKLAGDMTRFIRHVRISPHKSMVANRMKWDRDESFYRAEAVWNDSDADYPCVLGQPEDADQLTAQITSDVCQAYVTPRMVEMPVEITVERSGNVQFIDSKEVTFNAILGFDIDRDGNNPEDLDKSGNVKNSNTLYENEAYTFTLVFGEDGIELTGRKCEWEAGGNIIIPIYPILPEDETT